MPRSALPPVTTCRVSAPEELIEAIRGAELHAKQLTPSHRAGGELCRIPLADSCLDTAYFEPGFLLNGTMTTDCFALVYVEACERPGYLFNLDSEHSNGFIGLFPPGSCLDSIAPPGLTTMTLTIPEATFLEALEQHGGVIPDSNLRKGAAIRIDEKSDRVLRQTAREVRNLLKDPDEPLSERTLRENLETSLQDLFLDALTNSDSCSVGLSGRRLRRCQRLLEARDFVEMQRHRPIHVNELARAIGMTRRGLGELFSDLLGVSPVVFLRNRRLQGARDVLLRSGSDPGTIKRVALEWGFWHLGHFADEYHRLFDELPHETLTERPRMARNFAG